MSGSHTYDISNEHTRERVIRLLKHDWSQWHVQHPSAKLELVCRLHEEARTVEQNSRMWKMLGILENHGAVCAEFGRPLSATQWHKWLRIKHGFIHGTETNYLPQPDGKWLPVETPAPQPTAKGSEGQMTKAQHSEYMERILDELSGAGFLAQWEQEQAA